MEKVFYEDYQVGELLVSPGRTITETDIILFAGLTGDWHPIHTNVEYAKKTMFGERIAHGMLGLSVGSALIFLLVVFATLESTIGLCVGCKVFAVLMRVGVIPEEVCAECADLSLRARRLGVG